MTTQDIIKEKPYLAWYVKNPATMSEESVLEHILNYGNWDDVQRYIQIQGWSETYLIFLRTIRNQRTNYLPQIQEYFSKYLKKYAS